MNRIYLFIANVLLVAGAAFAQNSSPAGPERAKIYFQESVFPDGPLPMLQQGVQGNADEAKVFFFLTAEMAGDHEVIKNAPYTGTTVTESTQTLADGNRIVNTQSAFHARDSQGRTRREEAMGNMGPLQVGGPRLIFISDPVTHTDITLQPEGQRARVIKRDESLEGATINLRRKLEAANKERGEGEGGGVAVTRRLDPAGKEGIATTREERVKIDVKHEDLGMQDIEGLACHGRREIVTIPAGQIGNERPIVTSTEIWTSDDLHGVVLKKHTDPRFGETVYRLTNIKLGEPDASLFQVPSGYKITNKTEPTFPRD